MIWGFCGKLLWYHLTLFLESEVGRRRCGGTPTAAQCRRPGLPGLTPGVRAALTLPANLSEYDAQTSPGPMKSENLYLLETLWVTLKW